MKIYKQDGFVNLALLAIVVVVSIVSVTGFLGLKKSLETQEIDFGAVLFVTAAPTKLGGSGVAATDTTVNLVKLRTPADNKVTMTNFGDIGYGTIEPARTKKEFISFTGVTQNADGTASLTGVTRGLNFVSPYTASTTLRKAHPGGVGFVISNPPQLLDSLVSKQTDSFITSTVTFSADAFPRISASSTNPTDDKELTHKFYVDSLSAVGASPITESTAGIGIAATQAQLAVGTATGSFSGTTYNLLPLNTYFNATPGSTSSVVVTEADGDIAAGYIGQDQAYTWTAGHTFSGGVTSTGALIQTNTADFSGVNTLSGTTTISAASTTVDGHISFNTTTTFNGNARDSSGDDPFSGGSLLFATTSNVSIATTTLTTAYSFVVPGGTLGTDDAIVIRAEITTNPVNGGDPTFQMSYGGTALSLAFDNGSGSTITFKGYVEYVIFANSSTTAQFIVGSGSFAEADVTANGYGANITGETTASIDSTVDQTVLISGQAGSASAANMTYTSAYAYKLLR